MTDRQFEKRITLIQQGDKLGLKEIYDEYGVAVYQCVFRILHNRQDAEDITSEFFLKLWQIADTYCFGGRHKRWLVTIARNMALDLLKKRKREVLTLNEDTVEGVPNEPADSVSTEDTVSEKLSVAEALDSLEESEREIVNMRILADMTFKDIAAVLEKPLGTVTWKYRNAIEKLRKTVREEGTV